MDVMDGLEATRQIRSVEAMRYHEHLGEAYVQGDMTAAFHTPICAVTADVHRRRETDMCAGRHGRLHGQAVRKRCRFAHVPRLGLSSQPCATHFEPSN